MAADPTEVPASPGDPSQDRERYGRLAERLETLQRLTASLASARTFQELAAFVIDEVRPALRAQIGVIAVLSDDGKGLRNIGFKGVSDEVVGDWLEYPLDSPVPMAEAALTRKPAIVTSIEERNVRYPTLAAVHGPEHGGAVVCLPLLARGELVGALGFCFDCDRSFDEDDLRFLQALADQCALAIERARWYERAQEEVTARKAAEQRLEAVLASIDDHLVSYDRQWRYTFVNDKAAQVLRKTREELLGHSIWELFPDAIGNQYYQEVHQALAEQRIVRSEHYYAPFGTWFENRIYPSAEGVTVFSSDVTWRKKAEQALLDADRRKDEFLAVLAHELRNPLAPIVQAVHIARSPNATPEQKQWSHEVIQRQVRHMSLLLEDLLDVSRITRGKLQLKKGITQLSAVVESAIETARPLIEARNHTLHVELPAEPVELLADRLRLAQVLSNLLTNAAKYTDPAGEIRLTGACDGRQIEIAVIDNGIGIDSASLPKIFQMFSQIGPRETRADDGMGIGLALARSLIELHGGAIEAHSEGPGRGSRFTVRIPLNMI